MMSTIKTDHTVKRPTSIALVAFLLVAWCVVLNFQFLGSTTAMLASGDGPIKAVFFSLYMHVLWVCLGVAGVGIWFGKTWARGLAVISFLALTIATTFSEFAYGGLLSKVISYAVLTWLLFRPRANLFFSQKSALKKHQITD
jgi:hypothetical protein